MVPKLFRSGKSFKKLAAYLLHDAEKAQTSERLLWTHTLNLASDDVGMAVNEMLWTARSADWIKQQAGLSSGGRRLQHPVRHFSLNWHPSETPTREQMVATVEHFLKHMGWAGHQAVLFRHDDKEHAHVHVMLNAVHPETGRALNAGFEWRRSQAWAIAYEREHGLIFCEERLKPKEERDPAPTRESWEKFKKSETDFQRAEMARVAKTPNYFERHDSKHMNSREWEMLKLYQRRQRETFFITGKEAFREARNEAFREVREQFREQWSAFYAAKRSGHDRATLAEMKLAIKEAQGKALDERRTRACEGLRKRRDDEYQGVLAQQRFDRAELTRRQDQGLPTYAIMDLAYPSPAPAEVTRQKDAVQPIKEVRDDKGHGIPMGSDDRRAISGDFERATRRAVELDGTPSRERPIPAFREPAQPDQRLRCQSARAEQRLPSTERTGASVEKERIERTREMTERAVSRAKDEGAQALRASWNKSRRSRGDRD